MKKLKLIAFALIVFISFSGCEKDDICDEPTTPRLVIEFYDALNPTVLKNVTNLKIIGEDMTDAVILDEDGTDITKYLANGSKISIPLKTNLDTVKYKLILNSTSTTLTDNADFLEFNYTRENIFVSRACGFKTIFTLNNTNPVLLTDNLPADNLWIQDYTITTSNIETENETHIKIYF